MNNVFFILRALNLHKGTKLIDNGQRFIDFFCIFVIYLVNILSSHVLFYRAEPLRTLSFR